MYVEQSAPMIYFQSSLETSFTEEVSKSDAGTSRDVFFELVPSVPAFLVAFLQKLLVFEQD